jgi:hypothetical protein
MFCEENTTIELHKRVRERKSSLPLTRISSPSFAWIFFDRQTMMEIFMIEKKRKYED